MNDINTLVISGGGIFGFSVLGALTHFAEKGVLADIKTYAGTSMGAIISYLLCIGCTPMEITLLLHTKKILKKLGDFDIVTGTKGQGIVKYNILRDIMSELTIKKCGKLLTMKDIPTMFHKNLIITVFNLDSYELEYINPESHPDMNCLDAVQASSSIPFIFEPCIINGVEYIDGSIYDSFPILHEKINLEQTIGLYIQGQPHPNFKEMNIIQKFYNLLMIPILFKTKTTLKSVESKCKICHLKTELELQSTSFKITAQESLTLFSEGYNQSKDFLTLIDNI